MKNEVFAAILTVAVLSLVMALYFTVRPRSEAAVITDTPNPSAADYGGVPFWARGQETTKIGDTSFGKAKEEPEAACRTKVDDLEQDLEENRRTWSWTVTQFRDYPSTVYAGILAGPDTDSHPAAHLFRTALRSATATAAVNFAGHYSIVSVGMTGWGSNFFIVDRISGEVDILPYASVYQQFQENSNLLVLNAPEDLRKGVDAAKGRNDYPGSLCSYENYQGTIADVRPAYLTWTGEKFELLASSSIPPINPFWEGYVGMQKAELH